MSIEYTEKDIANWFDARTLARAKGYVDAVSEMEWMDGDVLCGAVQGTQRRPYHVTCVLSQRRNSGLRLISECTCPVGAQCKHAAALLLAQLRQNGVPGGVENHTQLAQWLDAFVQRHAGSNAADRHNGSSTEFALHMLYVIAVRAQQVRLLPHKALCTPQGQFAANPRFSRVHDIAQAAKNQGLRLDAADQDIARSIAQLVRFAYQKDIILEGSLGTHLLEKVVATGRAWLVGEPVTAPRLEQLRRLQTATARAVRVQWQAQPGAAHRLRPLLQAQPAATWCLWQMQPPCYIDRAGGSVGILQTPWPAPLLADMLHMPAVTAQEAALVVQALRQVAPDLPAPLPDAAAGSAHIITASATPTLILGSGKNMRNTVDYACVHFDYSPYAFAAKSSSLVVAQDDGTLAWVRRDLAWEAQKIAELKKTGFRQHTFRDGYPPDIEDPGALFEPGGKSTWEDIAGQVLPKLRARGWTVRIDADFRHSQEDIEEISSELRQNHDWFDVHLSAKILGRTIDLAPLLPQLLHDPRWLLGQWDKIRDSEYCRLRTAQGEALRIRAAQLKPVMRTLADLFGRDGTPAADEALRLSRWDLARIDELVNRQRWQFQGDAGIADLARRLQGSGGIAPIAAPDGLQAQLRPYQLQALAWLRFLRQHQLSGILADEMGLGKTLQTLAHLLGEKNSGHLAQPALAVLPTTLLHHWAAQARQFAPGLRVLRLHGAQRQRLFDQIAAHDLVLTTYPLLWRDAAVLRAQAWSLLILDEAQNVKNATTRAAQTIRALRARQRLCLTGTPLENHLGELWSQFDFLLPGLFGSSADFARRWRAPIEKAGDSARRTLLAQRVAPFILRRRKNQVAAELPPKTTMLQTVALQGAQADLYESVRASMHGKVHQAIAAHGLARSHIVVLDALLKLRQVCCDPQLVQLDGARAVHESAKREWLLQTLPEMLESGRRILLFSQFAGMLQIIARALDGMHIGYSLLTGQTQDRQTPVQRFQNGEVALFLISLKVGGTGLNLTAADTVIHYDPWWNPAVENQATDRAHRIGQDKPVFVYKLIAEGSVEEKILALQERKAQLAEAILGSDSAQRATFDAHDIEALLAPLPQIPAPRRRAAA